jgi:hypothetical protein
MSDDPHTGRHRSSGPHPRERARKSALAGQGTFAATRDLTALFLVHVGPQDDQLGGCARAVGAEWP